MSGALPLEGWCRRAVHLITLAVRVPVELQKGVFQEPLKKRVLLPAEQGAVSFDALDELWE